MSLRSERFQFKSFTWHNAMYNFLLHLFVPIVKYFLYEFLYSFLLDLIRNIWQNYVESRNNAGINVSGRSDISESDIAGSIKSALAL